MDAFVRVRPDPSLPVFPSAIPFRIIDGNPAFAPGSRYPVADVSRGTAHRAVPGPVSRWR